MQLYPVEANEDTLQTKAPSSHSPGHYPRFFDQSSIALTLLHFVTLPFLSSFRTLFSTNNQLSQSALSSSFAAIPVLSTKHTHTLRLEQCHHNPKRYPTCHNRFYRKSWVTKFLPSLGCLLLATIATPEPTATVPPNITLYRKSSSNFLQGSSALHRLTSKRQRRHFPSPTNCLLDISCTGKG